MKEIIVNPATAEALPLVLDFVEKELEAAECPAKALHQVLIATEEVFVNIASYAYYPEIGEATIRCSVDRGPLRVAIQFLDRGQPYNPLEHKLPDTSAAADEREIGGLGILMVRKSMTEVDYEHRDGTNILTIRKVI